MGKGAWHGLTSLRRASRAVFTRHVAVAAGGACRPAGRMQDPVALPTLPIRPSREITIENPPVYGGERHEVSRRRVFVDLVHGRID